MIRKFLIGSIFCVTTLAVLLPGFFILQTTAFAQSCNGICISGSAFSNPCTYGEGSGLCDAPQGGPPFGGINYCCNLGNGGGGIQPNYDCGQNTALSSYCNNGPRCANGYGYSNLYSCDPNIWDGCCVACLPAQTCDASTAGGIIPNGNCGWITCPQQCNQATCGNWSACGGYANNTCNANNGSQSRTCNYTLYNGSSNCSAYGKPGFTQTQGCTVDACVGGAGYTCTAGTCTTNIFVHVYIDYGHDGSHDANYPYGVVTIDGGNAQTTGSDGTVTFSGLTSGQTHTIAYSDNSPDFQQVGATSQQVTLNNSTGNVTVNFRVTPLYKISGTIFNDKNKNLNFDGSDTAYTSTTTVHISGGPTSVADMTQTDGTYSTPETLLSGTYTVSQTHALDNGYYYTTPSTWTVTVGDRGTPGPNCNVSTSPDAVCGNPNDGSISRLNFGVSNETPWQQSVCLDVRDDSGTYNNPIPAAPSCGGVSGAYNTVTNADCSTGAGIVFTCDGTPDFGLGSSNSLGWQSGGPGNQQECYTNHGLNVIRTSYDYLITSARESGVTPTDMTTVCGAGGLANCTLSGSLKKGIYLANGDVHLNAYTFPVDANTPQSFIFLINGNLYLDGNILIPAGSVAAFSAKGNIYVNPSVGQVVTDPTNPNVNNPNIEGLYSADGSFIVQSNGSANNYCNADGTPKDKKLNIIGSIVTNASQTGGSFVNNRDLCIYDLACPPVSTGGGGSDGNGSGDNSVGTSYLLTLYADGGFLNHKLFNWEEIKP